MGPVSSQSHYAKSVPLRNSGLGVNGKPFEANIIDTFRSAVEDAPLRGKDGKFSILLWRNGAQTTLDLSTLVPPPDLTKGSVPTETHDWTLWPTGTRSWLFSRGLDTADARQIRITKIEPGSPADGVLAIDDVILGVNGGRFVGQASRLSLK